MRDGQQSDWLFRAKPREINALEAPAHAGVKDMPVDRASTVTYRVTIWCR